MSVENIKNNCRNTGGGKDTLLHKKMQMKHNRGQQMAEFQNMSFKEVEICERKRTKDGLETAMENKETLGLSLCTGIHGE